MPSKKILEEKQAAVAALAEKMKNAAAGIVVQYQGITVEDDTKLRAALRAAGVEYKVVKNTITGRACDEARLRRDESASGGHDRAGNQRKRSGGACKDSQGICRKGRAVPVQGRFYRRRGY